MTTCTTSSAKLSADTNQTGSWQEVSFTVVQGTKISVDGKKVETSATASWSYVGGSTPTGPLPPVPDSAALNGSSTKLKDNGVAILRKGDKATGIADSGNYIEVGSGQTKLKSV